MRKIVYLAVVTGLGCYSLGCVAGGGVATGKSEAAVPIVTYQCNTKIIRTETAPGTNNIKLTLPDGTTTNLAAVAGSSGTKFSDGQVTFVLKGNEASVEFSSGRNPLTGCVKK